MKEIAIFSAAVFLAISCLLLCSCSNVDQGQGPSYESQHSKISGSGAVNY
jgi:antitoxin FitA